MLLFCIGLGTTTHAQNDLKILAMGDSMMAWNRITGRSIPQILGKELGVRVKNMSAVGAMFHGDASQHLGITQQYKKGDWDWVVINGGANDLIFKCSCNNKACQPIMDKMISKDGQSGSIPRLVDEVRKDGAKVLFVGYHRAREMDAPARRCGDDLDAMDARLSLMAKRWKSVHFANMQNVFPAGDTSFYAFDRTHPSPKGSKTMALALLPWFKK